MAPKNISNSPLSRLLVSSWPGFLCICFGLISYCILLPSHHSPVHTANHAHSKRAPPSDMTNLLQHGAIVTKRTKSTKEAVPQAAAPQRKLRGAAAKQKESVVEHIEVGAVEAAKPEAVKPAPLPAWKQERTQSAVRAPLPDWHAVEEAKAAVQLTQTDAKNPKDKAHRAHQKVRKADRKPPQTPKHALHSPHTKENHVQLTQTDARLASTKAAKKIDAKRAHHAIRKNAHAKLPQTPVHAAKDVDNHQAMHEWSQSQKVKSKSRNAHHAVRKYSVAPKDPHYHAPL